VLAVTLATASGCCGVAAREFARAGLPFDTLACLNGQWQRADRPDAAPTCIPGGATTDRSAQIYDRVPHADGGVVDLWTTTLTTRLLGCNNCGTVTTGSLQQVPRRSLINGVVWYTHIAYQFECFALDASPRELGNVVTDCGAAAGFHPVWNNGAFNFEPDDPVNPPDIEAFGAAMSCLLDTCQDVNTWNEGYQCGDPLVPDDAGVAPVDLDAAPPPEPDVAPTPEPVDSDGDGIPDAQDNCPDVANADQRDLDEDAQGDECDLDRDGINGVDLCHARRPPNGQWVVGRVTDEAGPLAVEHRGYSDERYRCDTSEPVSVHALRDISEAEFLTSSFAPDSPMWQRCYGQLDEATGDVVHRGDPDGPGCGWWWSNDEDVSVAIDTYFVPEDEIIVMRREAFRRGDEIIEPGTPDWNDETIRRGHPGQADRVIPKPPQAPNVDTQDGWKRAAKRRRALWEKARGAARLGLWWSVLPDAMNAVKVGFTYQALVHSTFVCGPVNGIGSCLPYEDPCRVYTPEWGYTITDVARRPPEERRALPDANPNHPAWPFLHNECECLPPVGHEDKCFDTEAEASWSRFRDVRHQIADERRVMVADAWEARTRYECGEPYAPGNGCYGGYREGERPPWEDTQGSGRFTVPHCMEPPVWSQAMYNALGIPRGDAYRSSYDAAWAVWPEFAKDPLDPTADPTKLHMDYADLVDLWVTWPMLDLRGPFDSVVPEDFAASLEALAEIYHTTPEAERVPVIAVVNLVYDLLRRLPLVGVPQNVAAGEVRPRGVDFIYDLFVRGSE